MFDENPNDLSLEKLLDKMLKIMNDYIALHKQEENLILILQKEKELETIHKIIRAKIEQSSSFK